jgi:serine/threonine-protein kinase
VSLESLRAALAARYRIERELGQGGMATVYLAEDLRHQRKVAIKVLKPELAAVIGAERFLAEIRTTATLQHPHVLPLFDSGLASVDGQRSTVDRRPLTVDFLYYVMPYVEGESLRDRLTREKQLPIQDAIRIATEVASALDYAHRHGVIHRDIKPENILLHDGSALVADFGIALAVSNTAGHRMTETGMSLGTPHYMSPEQALGERAVDARADIYALGAVTYEMLAGEPPFTGPTSQAIITRVMTEDPRSLVSQRRHVSAAMESAVLTALEKLPADRFGSAAEFAAAFSTRAGAEGSSRSPGWKSERAVESSHRRVAIGVLGAAALAIAGFSAGRRVPASDAPPIAFGRGARITWDEGLEVQPAISPDGRAVAYAAGTSTDTRIYVRDVAGGRAHRLTDDTTSVEADPSWSPDGSRVLFLAKGTVYSAPAAGGPGRQELPIQGRRMVTSATWAPDGQTIAYTIGDSLFLHAPDGGRRPLASLLQPTRCRWSPDGKQIACSSGNAYYLTIGARFGNLSPNRIVVCRVSDGRVTDVTGNAAVNVSPLWSRDGRWLYFISNLDGRNDIYAQRMTGDGLPAGDVERLTVGLGAQSISLSNDGTHLVYALYVTTSNLWSEPLPASGTVAASASTADPVTTGDQVIENASLSADGQWLLYDSNVAGNSDIYRIPIRDGLPTGNTPERLTNDPADDFAPTLSPDGSEVAFHSWREGSRDIWVQPLDGRPVERITSDSGQEWIGQWSPDGQALSFNQGSEHLAVYVVRRDSSGHWGKPVRRADGYWPTWSPDGRWLAFVRSRTGETFSGGGLYLISPDSGAERRVLDDALPGDVRVEHPVWTEDGRAIVFKSHDAKGMTSIWSVDVAGGPPRRRIRFDNPAWQSHRDQWTYGRGRAYFPVEIRQSDIWMMEVRPR